ncbi:redoxin domain-containing protein [Psychromarinibacter sp. S121]|uniref:redoxin domain-containing protein n=1 Tax=Psychromarinibacter sp. S121 TaxID=3415127 RepID=UPI003C7E9212
MGFENIFARKGQTQAYGPSSPRKTVEFPYGYRESVDWVPRIGDIFPNFRADSTHGSIDFHSWAEGRWVYFFSHPTIRSGVSATEVASIANAAPFFRKRGVEVLGLCADSAAAHSKWEAEIGRIFGLQIDYPVIDDREAHLSHAFGAVHPKQGSAMAIRKSFIIDPALRVRMLFEYPLNVGRSVDEILRVVDALQMVDSHRVGIPADWEAGDSVVVPPYMDSDQAFELHGQVEELSPSLRLVPAPAATGDFEEAPMPETLEGIYGR